MRLTHTRIVPVSSKLGVTELFPPDKERKHTLYVYAHIAPIRLLNQTLDLWMRLFEKYNAGQNAVMGVCFCFCFFCRRK